ncbi:MAG: NAD(P)-dependent alcohol dehydrogenase [Gammaproteobacteria bacterium]|nr:NAD(P)-dependent alcohol dehydrogenase [Gammaproteobacteria bacterium]
MQVTAAVARTAGAPLVFETLELEAPRAGEVRVRIVGAGVCHTDMVARDQLLPVPLPVVLGHEGSGIIEQVGPGVDGLAPGDRVVMSFDSCGSCAACVDQEPAYCHQIAPLNFSSARPDGSTALSRDGAAVHSHFFGQSSFATHAICPARSVVKVDGRAPLELLGPLGCGVQTGAGAAMNALAVRPGSSFAVVGAGSVGLSALLGAVVQGARVLIAVDVNEERLALARELGATHLINPRRAALTETILGITGQGVDRVLDTTGLADVIRAALLALAPRGVCGIVGASAPGSEIRVDEVHLMSAGRRLIGIVEGSSRPQQFIPRLIDLHLQGRFPFDRLVRYYPFADINRAIHDSEHGAAIKPILRMA